MDSHVSNSHFLNLEYIRNRAVNRYEVPSASGQPEVDMEEACQDVLKLLDYIDELLQANLAKKEKPATFYTVPGANASAQITSSQWVPIKSDSSDGSVTGNF